METRWSFVLVSILAAASFISPPAEARLTRITAGPPEVIDLPSFGKTGPYWKILGTFEGELDPADRRNAVIADINLVPGRVAYKANFFLLRPADLRKGNGKLFYNFNNRGNKQIFNWLNDGTTSDNPTTAEHFGNGFLMRYGYSVALSGWAGDVRPAPNVMSIEVPTAFNRDGTSITGKVVAERIPSATTQTTISLPYTSNSTTAANGVLTVRANQMDPKVPVEGWTWVNDRLISFPGPARVPWIYEFVYEAKDPKVMGVGHAATRDFLSFLKYGTADDFGNPNPLAMQGGGRRMAEDADDGDDDDDEDRLGQARRQLRAIYAWGRSNGGRVQRDFVRWGFNEDENGQMVFDGMIPYGVGAGGHVWMNDRWSQITVSSQQHSRHFAHEPEFPHTFPVMTDPLTGQRDGIFRRCLATKTCPKLLNYDGGNEYWNKTSSLNHTNAFGEDLDIDKLTPTARVYAIASIEHNTTFDQRPEVLAHCQQMTNPLYNGPIFRAAAVALDRWVTRGHKPPASRVYSHKKGTLVPPQQVKFPSIPTTHYAGWPALQKVNYYPQSMNRNAPFDFSEQPYTHIPGPEYVVQVAQVDSDGNEVGGVRLPFLDVPLGTHTGWNWYPEGAGSPNRCGQDGSFIPFANTKAERMAAGDPRPSIEERYRSHADYVQKVARAARKLVNDGFLLEEDEDRINERARRSGVQLWLLPPQ
jgi:hypothetical protein